MMAPVRERLHQEMPFAELTTLDGYRILLEANGCRVKEIEDLSEEWAQVLIKRLTMYRGLKDQAHHDDDHAHYDGRNSLRLHGFSSFGVTVPTPKSGNGISPYVLGVKPLRASHTD